MKADKQRRAGLRRFRKKLRLKQEELAVLAGVSLETVARFERGKHVSIETDASIAGALFRIAAKQNPGQMKQAVQPMLDAAEKWEKVLSVEPGSPVALELEKRNEKSLAELKAMAETLAPFLRSAGNNFLSWAE